MKSVAGIFATRADAERAIARVVSLGIARERINVLIPGMTAEELHTATPTTETEGEGMGKALGAVVGGASGAMLGSLGAAAASLLIPGIGPVAAVGLAAMALFGATGAVAGAAAGGSLENEMFDGLPMDELFVYEDALREGRSVAIVLADGDVEAAAVENALEEAGAMSVDAAQEQWWLAIRDDEAEQYRLEGAGDFAADEGVYRRGFECAHRVDMRGRPFDEVRDRLASTEGHLVERTPFRRGYERGRQRCDMLSSSGDGTT
jgi:hypothetical protein